MKRSNKWMMLAPCAMLAFSGCATIVTGTSQQISVDSNPAGAKCLVYRTGARVHEGTTPMVFSIDKSGKDLDIACSDTANHQARGTSKAGMQPWVLGNLFIGGLIGVVIDASSGAITKYDSPVLVTFDSAIPPPVVTPGKPGS